MLRKSASVRLGVALTTRSEEMPVVEELNNTLWLPAVPVVDSVPLIVCWEKKMTVTTPADAGPVTDKLLKVFEPVMILFPAVVEVNETL